MLPSKKVNFQVKKPCVRLLSGDKKNIAVNLFSKLGWELSLYYASYDDFHPDILARMYT